MSDRRLRVLQVIASLGASTGGPAQVVLGLSRALRRRDHEVSIFTTDLAGAARGWGAPVRGGAALASLLGQLRAEGIQARAYPILWPGRYAYAPQLGRALRREVRAFDVVHIHSLYLYSTWAAARACLAARVPYILRPHGILTHYQAGRSRRIKQLYERMLGAEVLAGAARIHYTSEQEAREARECGYTQPGCVVRLGVDVETFAALPARGRFRARYPAIGDKRVVLFMSRLAPKKGLDLLIPAFAGIHARSPATHLVIAGPDEAGYGTQVRRLVAAHHLDGAVTFIGMVTGERKLEALRDADVWALPSYAENFGIAAVEAMAAGLPAVISDRVDIHREVAGAKAGVVVPCAVEPLARALQDLLEEAALRREIGSRARAFARERFSWDGVAADMMAVYERVIGDSFHAVKIGSGPG